MSEPTTPSKMKPTLGLTGLTSNAMALIAPGAFLWLTFQEQASYGAPMAGQSMWFGILFALLLCLATAVSYAELSKLYPGAGSSYYYAEQAFLSKTKAYKFARIAKFMTGWASHLYYWVYPGLMVGVTAVLCGYLCGVLFPSTFSSSYNSPLLMILICIVFSLFVSWIAARGVTGTTGVNLAINIVQIAALLVFSAIALGYRLKHPQDSQIFHISNGNIIDYQVDTVNVTTTDAKGVTTPVQDAWADDTPDKPDPKWSTSASVTADTLDKAKNTDADLLAYLTTIGAKVGDPLYDYQKDKDGKYLKDKDGKLQMVPAYKQQDRAVSDDDLDPAKNKDPIISAAALKDLGLGSGDPYPVFVKDKDGKLTKDKDGKLMMAPMTADYTAASAISGAGTDKDPSTFNFHQTPGSVVAPHSFSFVFIQACVAILILVGFESVSSMGEEAKDAKRDIPKAILLALVIQGAFCYLIEYFCANYMMNNGYGLTNAAGSGAPIGDMMQIAGAWFFGSAKLGRTFMLVQAFTVFLALIGTTLSCLSTGARVTYAMGRDEEVPAHFGMLHGTTLSPHKSIWTLGIISIFIGILSVMWYLGNSTQTALDPMYTAAKGNYWYTFGIFSPETYAKVPNSLVFIGLISNFGTFLLYMFTCVIAIVAFQEHHTFSGFKHVVVPIFGVIANFACMLYYLIGSFTVAGMSWHEPYIALAVVALWGLYGLYYFNKRSKALNRPIYVAAPVKT